MNNPVLEAIKTRRVIRDMTDQPIETEKLESILEAARWSPTGGNLKLNRFVVVNKPRTLRLLQMVSPGMFPTLSGGNRHLHRLGSRPFARTAKPQPTDHDGCGRGCPNHDARRPFDGVGDRPSDILQPNCRQGRAQPARKPLARRCLSVWAMPSPNRRGGMRGYEKSIVARPHLLGSLRR
jgi:nitroreductase